MAFLGTKFEPVSTETEKYPVKFPVSREFAAGDWLDQRCDASQPRPVSASGEMIGSEIAPLRRDSRLATGRCLPRLRISGSELNSNPETTISRWSRTWKADARAGRSDIV